MSEKHDFIQQNAFLLMPRETFKHFSGMMWSVMSTSACKSTRISTIPDPLSSFSNDILNLKNGQFLLTGESHAGQTFACAILYALLLITQPVSN